MHEFYWRQLLKKLQRNNSWSYNPMQCGLGHSVHMLSLALHKGVSKPKKKMKQKLLHFNLCFMPSSQFTSSFVYQ